jgi:hypothetical protein
MINLKNDEQIEEFIRQHYRIFLERDADEEGLHHYITLLKSGGLKPEQLRNKFEESAEHQRLKSKTELVDKIKKDLEEVLINSKTFEEYLEKSQQKPEPEHIFVTCYNENNSKGGLFLLKNDFTLESIFEGKMCSNMFFLKESKILFTITKETPQILAFRQQNDKWISIPIKNKNIIFANDAHSIVVWKNKIYLTATGGDPNSDEAINHHKYAKDQYGTNVGKIIVSNIEIKNNEIVISNSKVFNPFNCNHHHHINDLCIIENSLYMTSHSYCNKEKQLISKGVITKINQNMKAEIISDKMEQPHSPFYYKKRLYVCSSAQALVLSMNLEDASLRIEFKGLNAYTRGLLVTDQFMYIGTSFSLGRTNSKFKNPNYGILKFSKDTGETKKVNLPKEYDNVYGIISSQ